MIIGTRGSQLAMWQAEFVRSKILAAYGGEVTLKKIKTTGDKILDSPLAKIGEKGLFVKEIEVALAKGEVDIAVHSMKDLPTEILPELTIGAYLKRDNPADALISREGKGLDDLPEGAVIGTSSLRRKAQLMAYRPDLEFIDMRGNVDTRLRKLEEQRLDAILLSGAGLTRLGWEDRITERIPTDVIVPAVGQGVIAVEIRKDDEAMLEVADELNDLETQYCVVAERSFSLAIEGGCQIPMGALAVIDGAILTLKAAVASLDGKRLLKDMIEGDPSEGDKMGQELALRMLKAGADKILDEIRKSDI